MLNKSAGYHRYKLVITVIAASVLLLAQCMNANDKTTGTKEQNTAPDYTQYAGTTACLKCHQDIAGNFLHTAHHFTSAIADDKNILGSFDNEKNTLVYNASSKVMMEKDSAHFYQVLYNNGVEERREPIDITIGSGRIGQTYLYWKKDSIFQLPVSYFSAAKAWSNSPGFPNRAVFYRDVTSRCMECHSTYGKTTTSTDAQVEAFDRRQIIYGVECEKCHGPAAQHVAYQQQHPTDTIAHFIVNPASFSRQQKLDLCALCHGGRLQKMKPSFSFVAGDTLSHFFAFDTQAPDPYSVDVHGNQYGLLRSSQCFRKSDTLTCNTCHNTHKFERGNLALFSSHCLSCHGSGHTVSCKLTQTLGKRIETNCIDCHMPQRQSNIISVLLPGKTEPVAARIRSHYISIYPEEAKKVLEYMKQAPK